MQILAAALVSLAMASGVALFQPRSSSEPFDTDDHAVQEDSAAGLEAGAAPSAVSEQEE